MELKIVATDKNCPILCVSGAILLKDAESFDVLLQSLVTTTEFNKLLIDMSGLESWNSRALSSLLTFIEDWQKEEKLIAIFGMKEELIQEISRKGMRELIPIYYSEIDARASIGI